jgi:serine protease
VDFRFLLFLPLVGTAAAAPEVAPGHLIVRYRSPARLKPELRHLRQLDPATHLIAAADPESTARALAEDPDVLFAEPDYVRRPQAVRSAPNDPLYPLEWALPLIHAPAAWLKTTGSSGVTVAVLDTGILPHPDLAGRLVPGWDFVSDPGNAGDGDGRDPDPTDPGQPGEASSGLHGLHVAGIVGAVADNGRGVAGLDWACRIQPIRVLGVNGGRGLDSDIADAIRWAAGLRVDGAPDNATPADVINLSFGGHGISHTLQAAVDDATARGAVVVAAAGNDGGETAAAAPAGLSGVITVGAVDPTGRRAAYSNRGPEVALLAPGGGVAPAPDGSSSAILSTMWWPTGFDYGYLSGTSQAAPYVAATLAMMKAVWPSLTPDRARAVLQASADARARCPDGVDAAAPGCGAGLLDVEAAVALGAGQPACAPGCGTDEICEEGRCLHAQALDGLSKPSPRAPVGCSLGADAATWPPGLAWLLPFFGWCVRRQVRGRARGLRIRDAPAAPPLHLCFERHRV